MTTTQQKRTKLTIVSDTEVLIEREFAAPARFVYEACTKPEYMKRWYGCDAMQMVKCEMDVRVGGSFAWTVRMAENGMEFNFRGDYLELDPPKRMVSTEQFLMGDTWTNKLTQTAVFHEKDGKTQLELRLVYQTKQDRDGHLGAGMEGGMNDAHARLDELVQEMARG